MTVYTPAELAQRLGALSGRTVCVDPVSTAVWFDTTLQAAGATVVDGTDPCTLPKAIKNSTEQEGARRAHAHDGVAMARFLYSLTVSGMGQHETDLVTRLDSLRARSRDYREQSFDALSAVGPNGASPHYRPQGC